MNKKIEMLFKKIFCSLVHLLALKIFWQRNYKIWKPPLICCWSYADKNTFLCFNWNFIELKSISSPLFQWFSIRWKINSCVRITFKFQTFYITMHFNICTTAIIGWIRSKKYPVKMDLHLLCKINTFDILLSMNLNYTYYTPYLYFLKKHPLCTSTFTTI